jgi:chromosomal replication initiation ATPase DnaA
MIEFYAACNLTNNPFRSTPVRESDPRQNIWVGYEREKQLLLKYIVRTRADQVGNDNFVIIYGDYGTGKTHALRWSKDYIQGTHQDNAIKLSPQIRPAGRPIPSRSLCASSLR